MSPRLHLVPPQPLTAAESRLAMRRLRLQREHGVRFYPVGDMWQADVPLPKGGALVTRPHMEDVIAEVEEFFAPEQPDG